MDDPLSDLGLGQNLAAIFAIYEMIKLETTIFSWTFIGKTFFAQ
jgi:hypothetical protein